MASSLKTRSSCLNEGFDVLDDSDTLREVLRKTVVFLGQHVMW
jgi:hypothetical protein